MSLIEVETSLTNNYFWKSTNPAWRMPLPSSGDNKTIHNCSCKTILRMRMKWLIQAFISRNYSVMININSILVWLDGCRAVSKLREHWEDTAAAVTARKNQLETLLGDSHQFERRRQDVDQWLSRMENRLFKLAPVAATADMIESQHREQKVAPLVFFNEWIKHLIMWFFLPISSHSPHSPH